MKKVLVVDDEESVRRLCCRVLALQGYDAEAEESPVEALARLRSGTFDLLLTDLRMPGDMSGVDLAKSAVELHPKIAVMIMTAFPGVETAVDTFRMGAFDYMIKPFDQAYLVERVRACLFPNVASS